MRRESVVAVVLPNPEATASALATRLLQELQRLPRWWESAAGAAGGGEEPPPLFLGRTKSLALDAAQAKQLAQAAALQKSQQAAVAKLARLGACVALQVHGTGAYGVVKDVYSTTGADAGRIVLVEGNHNTVDHLFSQWGEAEQHAPVGVTV